MSAPHRVVPTLTEVVDEAVLEGREAREPRPVVLPHLTPGHQQVDEVLAASRPQGLDGGLLDLSDLSLNSVPSPIAAQFLAQLPELCLDLPDLSLRLRADSSADEDFLADTRVPGQEDEAPATRPAALPADQELAYGQAIDEAVDDALDEVLDQVLEKAVLALRAQLHSSVKAAVLRRLREQAEAPR